MPYATSDAGIKVYTKDADGLARTATLSTGVPPTTADTYAVGCDLTVVDTGVHYRNEGTSAEPNWVTN
jgi:hypothetical protein